METANVKPLKADDLESANAKALQHTAGGEAGTRLVLPSADDLRWEGMIRRGRKLWALRKSGEVIDGKEPSDKLPRNVKEGNRPVPRNVRDWILLRQGGLSVKKASEQARCSWAEVRACYVDSEDCRYAMTALHEDSRHLMREMAYSTMEEALDGAVVTKAQVQVACRVLSAMETEHFGDPRQRSGLTLAGSNLVGGGITIQLMDVSKGYAAPQAALIGDGEEGVTV